MQQPRDTRSKGLKGTRKSVVVDYIVDGKSSMFNYKTKSSQFSLNNQQVKKGDSQTFSEQQNESVRLSQEEGLQLQYFAEDYQTSEQFQLQMLQKECPNQQKLLIDIYEYLSNLNTLNDISGQNKVKQSDFLQIQKYQCQGQKTIDIQIIKRISNMMTKLFVREPINQFYLQILYLLAANLPIGSMKQIQLICGIYFSKVTQGSYCQSSNVQQKIKLFDDLFTSERISQLAQLEQELSVKDFLSQFVNELLKKATKQNATSLLLITYQSMFLQKQFNALKHNILRDLSLAAYNQLFQFCTSLLARFQSEALAKNNQSKIIAYIFQDSLKITAAIFGKLDKLGFFNDNLGCNQISHRLIQFFVTLLASNFAIFHFTPNRMGLLQNGLKHMNQIIKNNQLKKLYFYKQDPKSIQSRQFLFLALLKLVLYVESSNKLSNEIQLIIVRMIKQKLTLLMVKSIFTVFYFARKCQSTYQNYNFPAVFRMIQCMQTHYSSHKLNVKKFCSESSYITKYLNKQDFPCNIYIQIQTIYILDQEENSVLDLFSFFNQKKSKIYSIVIRNYPLAIQKQKQRLINKRYLALQTIGNNGQLISEVTLRQIDICGAETLSFQVQLTKSSLSAKFIMLSNEHDVNQQAKQIQIEQLIQKIQFGKNPIKIQRKKPNIDDEIRTNGLDELKTFQVQPCQVSKFQSIKNSQNIKDRLSKRIQNLFSRKSQKEDEQYKIKNTKQYSFYNHLQKIGGIDACVIVVSYLLKVIENQKHICLIINKFAMLLTVFQQQTNNKIKQALRMKYILCLICEAVRFNKSTRIILNIFDQFYILDDSINKQSSVFPKKQFFQTKNQKISESFLELLCNFNIWRRLDKTKCNEIVSKIGQLFDGFSSMQEKPAIYQFHQSTVVYLCKKLLFDSILMNQDPYLMDGSGFDEQIRFTERIGELICHQIQKLISIRYHFRKKYENTAFEAKKSLKKSKGDQPRIVDQNSMTQIALDIATDNFQNLLIKFFHFILDVLNQILRNLLQKVQKIESSNKKKTNKNSQDVFSDSKAVALTYFQFEVTIDILSKTTAHFCKRKMFSKIFSQHKNMTVQQKMRTIIQKSKSAFQKQVLNKILERQYVNSKINPKSILLNQFKCYIQILHFQRSMFKSNYQEKKINNLQIPIKKIKKIKDLQIVQQFSCSSYVLRAVLQVLINNQLCIQILQQLLQTIEEKKIKIPKIQILRMLNSFFKLRIQNLKQDNFNFSYIKPFLKCLQIQDILQVINQEFKKLTKKREQKQGFGNKDKAVSSIKSFVTIVCYILFIQERFHIKNSIQLMQNFRAYQSDIFQYLQSILILRYLKQTIVMSQQLDLQQNKKNEATFFETSDVMMMKFMDSFSFIQKNCSRKKSAVQQNQAKQYYEIAQKIAQMFKILQKPKQSEKIIELKQYKKFIQEDLLQPLNQAVEQIIYGEIQTRLTQTFSNKQVNWQQPKKQSTNNQKEAQQNRKDWSDRKKNRKDSDCRQKDKDYQFKALLSLSQFVIQRRQQLSEIPKIWKKIRQNNRYFWKMSQTNQNPPDYHLDSYCNGLKQKIFLSEQTQKIQVSLPRVIDAASSIETSFSQKSQKIQKSTWKGQKLKQQSQFFYEMQGLKTIKSTDQGRQIPGKKRQQKKNHQWKIGLVKQDKTIQGVLEIQINNNANEKRRSFDKLKFSQLDYIDQQLHKFFYVHKTNQRTMQEIVNYKISFQIRINKIRKITPKKYLQQPLAIEILSQLSCHFFLFATDKQRQQFISLINKKSHIFKLLENNHFKFQTEKWRKGIISNFQYIMSLNDFAGRSFNDTSQYYVFPWTVTNFVAEKFNQQFLSNQNNFRNLSQPIGRINQQRFENFRKRYNDTLKNSFCDMVPFLYGSFFSNSAVVSNFLIRISQFSMNHFLLQNNSFDIADRLFFSVKDQYNCTYNNFSDLKELIPEFYSNWQFLVNRNNYQFGKRQGLSQKVNNVQLPKWTKTKRPQQFIFKMRKALQCDYVKAELSKWIDLVFGRYNQRELSMERENLYDSHVYPCNLTEMEAEQADTYLLFYKQFGQMPSCLFQQNHKKPREQAYQCKQIGPFKDVLKKIQNKQNKKIQCNRQIRFNLNMILYSFADQIHYICQNFRAKQSWKSIKQLKGRSISSFDIMDTVSIDFTPQLTVFYISQGDLYLSHIKKVIIPFSEYKSTVPILFSGSSGNCSIVRTLNQYLIVSQGSNLKIYVHRADQKLQDGDQQSTPLKIPHIYMHSKRQFSQHSSDIVQIQVNPELSLVTSIDRMGKVFMLHIGSIISVRSFFDIKQIEFSEQVKKLIVHSMGFLIILTSQNRILLYNYFGQALVNVLVKFKNYWQKYRKPTNEKNKQKANNRFESKKVQQKLVEIQLWSQQSMDILLATNVGQLWRVDLFDLSVGSSDLKQVKLPHQEVECKLYKSDILYAAQWDQLQSVGQKINVSEQEDRNIIQSLRIERFGVHWKIHCLLSNGKAKTTESPYFSQIKNIENIKKRIQTD